MVLPSCIIKARYAIARYVECLPSISWRFNLRCICLVFCLSRTVPSNTGVATQSVKSWYLPLLARPCVGPLEGVNSGAEVISPPAAAYSGGSKHVQ